MYDFKFIGIGILLICLSIWYCSDRYYNQSRATVLDAICQKDGSRYKCSANISYSINGKKYHNSVNNIYQKSALIKGDTVLIFYNNINPMLIQYGFGKLICSIIVFIIGGFFIWLGSQI